MEFTKQKLEVLLRRSNSEPCFSLYNSKLTLCHWCGLHLCIHRRIVGATRAPSHVCIDGWTVTKVGSPLPVTKGHLQWRKCSDWTNFWAHFFPYFLKLEPSNWSSKCEMNLIPSRSRPGNKLIIFNLTRGKTQMGTYPLLNLGTRNAWPTKNIYQRRHVYI